MFSRTGLVAGGGVLAPGLSSVMSLSSLLLYSNEIVDAGELDKDSIFQ